MTAPFTTDDDRGQPRDFQPTPDQKGDPGATMPLPGAPVKQKLRVLRKLAKEVRSALRGGEKVAASPKTDGGLMCLTGWPRKSLAEQNFEPIRRGSIFKIHHYQRGKKKRYWVSLN